MKSIISNSKKGILSLLFYMIIFSTLNLYPQSWQQPIENTNNFYFIQKAFNEFWKDSVGPKGSGWKQFKRWEAFWEPRVFPTGQFPNGIGIYKDFVNFKEKIAKTDKPTMKANWKEFGPITIPQNRLSYNSSGLGRINCVRFHPTNPDIIWIGSSAGGAWVSKDRGNSWNVSDFTQFLSIGVTDIAISESNPNIMYISTGDADGNSMTRGYSIGVIKSTDAGNTWKPTTLSYEIASSVVTGRIFVHPLDPNIVIVATSSGILKSKDGGVIWENKKSGINFRDIIAKSNKPSVLYAATFNFGGSTAIYKSEDLGETWNIVKQFSGINRIVLGVSADAPDNVYALCSNTSNGFGGFYFSNDEGVNWTSMSTNPNILNISNDGSGSGGQGYYDLALAIAPFDSKLIYAGGIHIWKSIDGGVSWSLVNHWTGGYGKPYVHADQHDLQFSPHTGHLYSANDGGIYRANADGTSWQDLSNGISIAQFYRFSNSATNANMVIGGTQDNGSHLAVDGKWYHVNGGDGMETLIDFTDSRFVYSSMYNGSLYKSTNGGLSFYSMVSASQKGERGAWTTPFIINPQNPKSLYVGFYNIWKSDDRGTTWKKISNYTSTTTVNALQISPTDTNIIYYSTGNIIYKSVDGAKTFSRIGSLNAYISYITVDYNNPHRIWVSLSGYYPTYKVYEFDGTDWKNLTRNLPNVPANTIVYQKNSPDRLYLGTDIGVFYTDNSTDQWEFFNEGMPNVVVTELEIQYSSGKLRAATFGRGIWETEIINCNLTSPEVTIKGNTTFCQGDSVILEMKDPPYLYKSIKWSSGDTSKSIVVKTNGEYSVYIEDFNGCSAKSSNIKITVYSVPTIKIITKGNNPICVGDSLVLSASLGFQSYLWSTGDTTKKITVREPNRYWLKGTTAQGCQAISDILDVTIAPLPQKPTINREGNWLICTPASAYQWYLNDIPIQGATSQTYYIKQDGTYKVEITDENGCKAFSNPTQEIVGIEEPFNDESIRIIPNPSDGTFTLQNYLFENAYIKINVVNALGKTLYSTEKYLESGHNQITIDLSNFAKNVYFLIIQINERTYYKKLIKR